MNTAMNTVVRRDTPRIPAYALERLRRKVRVAFGKSEPKIIPVQFAGQTAFNPQVGGAK